MSFDIHYQKLLKIVMENKCDFPKEIEKLGFFLEKKSVYAEINFYYKGVFPCKIYIQYVNGNYKYFYIYFLKSIVAEHFDIGLSSGLFDEEIQEWDTARTSYDFLKLVDKIIESYESEDIIKIDQTNRIKALEL